MDRWDKAKIASQVFATIAVPLLVAFIGSGYTKAVAEREIQARFVEIAIQILRQSPEPKSTGLREWALNVVDKYSGVPMSTAAKRELQDRALILYETPDRSGLVPSDRLVARDNEATERLRADPRDADAWNTKGSVAFYWREYRQAQHYFRKALEIEPDSIEYKDNLGDALVALGQCDAALNLYRELGPQLDGWPSGEVRAYLCANRCEEAEQLVPSLREDNTMSPGYPKVLEAAVAMCSAQRLGDDERQALVSRARSSLNEAFDMAPHYWRAVLTGQIEDPHSPLTVERGLLAELISQDAREP